MQTITVKLNLSRGSCRINQPLYLGETVALSFSESGAYSLILTEPFVDSPKDGIVVWAQSTATGELSLNRKALHSAFKKAEAMQPNMTISAKCFVISEDGQTVADGEVAIEYSPKAFVIDEEDYPSARELLSQATSAKDQAIAAKDSAIAAKAQAESAQTGAEKAKAQAISESRSATTEKEKAQQAATLAAQHATTATNASSSALKAQTEAEKAQYSAETAASAAQAAKDKAQGIANETAQQQVEKVRQELLPLISEKANSAEFDKVVEKIATLIGNDDGYSVRQIAAGLVAEVVAGADKGFDTLKEIADWILNDTTGAAALANAAEDLKNKTLNLENSKANRSELKTKADATALEAEVTRAKSAEKGLDERVTELEEKPSVEVVAPSADGAGKAADAKATYEALENVANNVDELQGDYAELFNDVSFLNDEITNCVREDSIGDMLDEEFAYRLEDVAYMHRENEGVFSADYGRFGGAVAPEGEEEFWDLAFVRGYCGETLRIGSNCPPEEMLFNPFELWIPNPEEEYSDCAVFIDPYGTLNVDNGIMMSNYDDYGSSSASIMTGWMSLSNSYHDEYSGYNNYISIDTSSIFVSNGDEGDAPNAIFSTGMLDLNNMFDEWGDEETGEGAGDHCSISITPIGINFIRASGFNEDIWGWENYIAYKFNPFIVQTKRLQLGDAILDEDTLIKLLELVNPSDP